MSVCSNVESTLKDNTVKIRRKALMVISEAQLVILVSFYSLQYFNAVLTVIIFTLTKLLVLIGKCVLKHWIQLF